MRRSIQDAFRGAALLTLITCFGCDLQGISMDVLPGSDDNIIGVEDKNRLIPVALLGAETFSLAAIDPASLAFGPAGATIAREVKQNSFEDVDFDGLVDLVVQFRTSDTGIELGDTEVCLVGASVDGTPFRLCEAINATTSTNGKGGGTL
jgi:hypothetical protein